MTALRLLEKIVVWLVLCSSLVAADSLQLRDGRHLHGKYVGGTTTMVGFMTAGSIEYFATSDVLALIFENTSDSPLSGLQPNPMRGKSVAGSNRKLALRRVHGTQSIILASRRQPGPKRVQT